MLISSDNLVRDFHTRPFVDLTAHITAYWSQFVQRLGWKLVFIFDGEHNEAKGNTNATRAVVLDNQREKMNNLRLHGRSEQRSDLLKEMKQCMYVREDVILATKRFCTDNNIPRVCAFMEPDAQLLQLELAGITHGTISEVAYLCSIWWTSWWLETWGSTFGHNEALYWLSSSFCHALVMKHSTLVQCWYNSDITSAWELYGGYKTY